MSARKHGPASLAIGAAVGVLVLACAGACSELKRADDAVADSAGESASSGQDGASPDGPTVDGAVDAGLPPADFECPGDAWTKATKSKPQCQPRQVRVITGTAPLDVRGVAIARTAAGRVGIVYNSEDGAETGEMHLAHFSPVTESYAAPVIVKRATGFSFHDGYATKIAASAPDTLAVLSYDMDDSVGSGEVHLRKLVGGKEPLTDDLVFSAVKSPTEIAVASDPMGNVYATVRIATGATTAKLSVKTKTPSGGFTALPDLASSLLPSEAPGGGSASLFIDTGNQLHVLYHHNEVMQHSNPRYHTLAGTDQSYRKTLDNQIIDGLSGFSPRVAVWGTKKFATYYFRKAAQVVPKADLRLATWEGATEFPVIEVLDQSIPSSDAQYPQYRAAMAVDKYGLVHLAIVKPSNMTSGYVEYRRQTRITGGGTKWLSDIVDPDVISEFSNAYVDLVVDENARPHIAYRSAVDGKVRYATRFDR